MNTNINFTGTITIILRREYDEPMPAIPPIRIPDVPAVQPADADGLADAPNGNAPAVAAQYDGAPEVVYPPAGVVRSHPRIHNPTYGRACLQCGVLPAGPGYRFCNLCTTIRVPLPSLDADPAAADVQQFGEAEIAQRLDDLQRLVLRVEQEEQEDRVGQDLAAGVDGGQTQADGATGDDAASRPLPVYHPPAEPLPRREGTSMPRTVEPPPVAVVKPIQRTRKN